MFHIERMLSHTVLSYIDFEPTPVFFLFCAQYMLGTTSVIIIYRLINPVARNHLYAIYKME